MTWIPILALEVGEIAKKHPVVLAKGNSYDVTTAEDTSNKSNCTILHLGP